jgi:hypothetical protein
MSKVLVDRDRVVESMCLTWRHDFGIDKLEGCDFCSGMTDKEREHLRGQMGKLFDHHFAPAMSAVTAEQQPLLPTASDLEAVLDECEAFRDLSDVAHGWYEALECISRLKKERTQ